MTLNWKYPPLDAADIQCDVLKNVDVSTPFNVEGHVAKLLKRRPASFPKAIIWLIPHDITLPRTTAKR